MTFKILHITDLHLNPLTQIPQSRSEDYHEHVRKEWTSFAEVAKIEKADVICISGDIFHLKNPRRYVSEDVLYYNELFDLLPCPVLLIPGNHDMQASAYENINKNSPFRLFQKAGHPNLRDISFDNVVFPASIDHEVNQSNTDFMVAIYGLPYFPIHEYMIRARQFNEKIGELDYGEEFPNLKICLGHCDALPQDDIPLHWDYVAYKHLMDELYNVDVLLLGHIHQSFPVWTQTNETTGRTQMVSKPWSFGRVVRDYFTSTEVLEHQHIPSYAVIEIQCHGTPSITAQNTLENKMLTVDIKYKQLPFFVPFEQAFLRESLIKQIDDSRKVSSFIAKLKEEFGTVDDAFTIANPGDFLTKFDLQDLITKAKLETYVDPVAVRNLIQHYLETG
ncbi:MAG TPA: hypothetical protein ENI23_16240 [bacterium]|nr:hypothetical protein [bacterium]